MRHAAFIAAHETDCRSRMRPAQNNPANRMFVLLRGASLDKGRGVGFDLSHGFPVIHFLPAGWALVKFQSWY
jgi:hypothetical protein